MRSVVQVYDRVVDPEKFEGGAAEVVWRQCVEASKEFSVTLLTGNVAPAVGVEYPTGSFTVDGVRVVRLRGVIPRGPPPLNRRVLVADLPATLDSLIAEAEAPTVHTHFMVTPSVLHALLIAEKHAVPSVFQPHYHPPEIYPEEEQAYRRAYMSHLFPVELGMADAIVTVNSMELEILHREHGVPRNKLHHIPNGINPKELERRVEEEKLRARYGIGDAQVVVHVGRLSKRKNPLDALRAFASATKGNPRAVMVFVGRRGNQYEEVRRFVDAEGIGNRVIFTDFVPTEERNAWVSLADVVVALSRWEAFGISVAQALALGTPVVATKAGGLADFVRHGENGFLVDVGDVDSAADHLRFLLENPDEAEAMGVRGRRLVLREFTWSKIGERLRALYRSLNP